MSILFAPSALHILWAAQLGKSSSVQLDIFKCSEGQRMHACSVQHVSHGWLYFPSAKLKTNCTQPTLAYCKCPCADAAVGRIVALKLNMAVAVHCPLMHERKASWQQDVRSVGWKSSLRCSATDIQVTFITECIQWTIANWGAFHWMSVFFVTPPCLLFV